MGGAAHASNVSRESTCGRSGCPSATRGWRKSPASSCVMPNFSITRRDAWFPGTVKATISPRPSELKPNATAARVASRNR